MPGRADVRRIPPPPPLVCAVPRCTHLCPPGGRYCTDHRPRRCARRGCAVEVVPPTAYCSPACRRAAKRRRQKKAARRAGA